jgi:sugar O-acyltransferase (sialic acid O-acetyltransferase NeuD family)
MPTPLVIVGDSSFAEIAFEYFEAEKKFEVVCFAVDRQFLRRDTLFGRPVIALEDLPARHAPDQAHAFVALTYGALNRNRSRLVARMRAAGYRLASYVSKQAFVWPNVKLGENCFIFENNVIQPFVTIGDNVIAWSGNHIGHHTAIGDNVFLASHVVVSGHVKVGRNCFFGVNATVADSVSIADDNWIGPNTLISQDTAPGTMYRAEPTASSKVQSYRFFKVAPSDV